MIVHALFRLKMTLIHFVLWHKGLKVYVTDYASTLDEVYIFRKKVYVDEGYFAPGVEVPDVWKDAYDERSRHIFIKKNDRIVAATRLVYERPFPIQLYFNVEIPDYPCGEFSRLVIDKEFRGGSKGALLALSYGIIKTSWALNIPHWVMFMPKRFKESLEKLGLTFSELPQKPLESFHQKYQESLQGYFKNDVHPYMTNIQTLIHGFVRRD